MDIKSLSPFHRGYKLFEATATFGEKIKSLTKSKKYVSLAKLKRELDVDDDMFNEIIGQVHKSNRFSNKYIFTDIDGEQAVGIAAAKRGGKKKQMTPAPSQTNPGTGIAHNVRTKAAFIRRENQLWEEWHKRGTKGMDRLGILPEGHMRMSPQEIIELILESEFSD